MCFTLILWNEPTTERLKAPDAFDRVGVDIAHDPLLGAVIHALVARVAVADPDVRLEFVGVDRLGLVADRAPNEVMDRVLPDASVGPSKGLLPIASLMRWQRNHAVLRATPSVRRICLALMPFLA